MEVVAVDWSGAARGAASRIWLAHVVGGELITLRNGRSRQAVTDDLSALRDRAAGGLVAGLDFSFSLPAWFLQAHSCSTVDALWSLAEQEGERWLAEGAPPFWGRPGHPRPPLSEHFRQTEKSISVRGISPKSTFQIGGAGAVGTGSIRGMPYLRQLRTTGFSIWPFDPPSSSMILEVYPRLMTGPVHKSNLERRAQYVSAMPWSVTSQFAACMIASEDAFDAAISALLLHDHQSDLSALRQTTDPLTLLEGDVWRPPKIEP